MGTELQTSPLLSVPAAAPVLVWVLGVKPAAPVWGRLLLVARKLWGAP